MIRILVLLILLLSCKETISPLFLPSYYVTSKPKGIRVIIKDFDKNAEPQLVENVYEESKLIIDGEEQDA